MYLHSPTTKPTKLKQKLFEADSITLLIDVNHSDFKRFSFYFCFFKLKVRRHHKRWRSGEQIVSFTSLYRADHNTSEICLSYNPGSDFVETSSSSTKSVSLWKMVPVQFRKIEDYDASTDDVRSFSLVPEDAFHLINYKSNLSIGFIDGVPEIVKKPGSAFRVKVLQYVLGEVPRTYGNAPSVDVRIENISLIILHEVSDARDEVPLVRCCMTGLHVVAHNTSTKVRLLGSFNASMQYFDARKDEWLVL
jgi:hypothetical protein